MAPANKVMASRPFGPLTAKPAFWFCGVGGVAILYFLDGGKFNVLDHGLLVACLAGLMATVTLFISLLLDCFRRRLANDLVYLAAEAANEAGPSFQDYTVAIGVYDDLLRRYIENLGSHKILRFLKFISPWYGGPEPSLNSIRTGLSRQVCNIEEAKNVVAEAGLALCKLVEYLYDLTAGSAYNLLGALAGTAPLAWKDADEAIDAFIKAAAEFQASRTFTSSKKACLKSRVAGATVHGAWSPSTLAVNEQAKVEQFLRSLRLVHRLTLELAQHDESNSVTLQDYSRSLNRRIKAVEQLIHRNREELSNILLDAARYSVA